jgi:prepilin-type N-terminal cleavage/methylation domain-containing protein
VNKKGFTLMEFMVVIGLSSILMAILSPILAQAKRRAQEGVCLTHLHQIYLGFRLAADDLQDYDIEDLHFQEAAKYVPQSLLTCPLSSPGDPSGPWDGIERVPRPTGSEVGRVPSEAPFLEDAVHHRLYHGPWLVITGEGSARRIASDCRPWYEKTETGDYLFCGEM